MSTQDVTADMGVTGNALLLLGFIAGGFMRHAIYRMVDADPTTGEQTVENITNGNTYRVSVVQLTGTE